ncbi:TetR/AcrR family transcriptional regulator [Rhodococcus sp. UNC363MFTsu5.1]|uniref:TetR/AcrR family transcriptional regulator n=1 Tax=Rhodococcus sp. UNC363MFTsu5.1 TaxID=1449069 RepID=UPI000482B423|nr:TetR/AcrR family transcriptional regulator [Rhodococcus sp. UNC363MFTsu5.1]
MSTAPAARPLRADAERNRRKILDAAMELFASRGIDITLDDVARHAKVGVGTVYRRFTCKQELVDGVFEQSMDQIAGAAEEALRREDPWSALVDFIGLTSEWMSLSRGLGDVFFTNDEGREQVACARQRITPAIQQLVDRAKDAGALRPEIQVNDLFAVSCMLDAVIDFNRPVSPETWRRYLALVLDGMRADGAERAPLPLAPLTDEQVEAAKTARARG